MRKIRIGKDIAISWRVLVDGESRALAGLDLTLELHDERRNTVRPIDFTTDGDRLLCTVRGTEQEGLGNYSLTLWLNRGREGQSVLDASDAFCLVARTEMEGGADDDNLVAETVELTGELRTDLIRELAELGRLLHGTDENSRAATDPFLRLGAFDGWAAANAALDDAMRQSGDGARRVSGRLRLVVGQANVEVLQFCRSAGDAETPPLYVQVASGALAVDEGGLTSGGQFAVYARSGYIDTLGELSLTMWKEYPDMDGYATRTDLQNMAKDFNKHLDDRGSFASNTEMEADFAAAATDEPLVLFGKSPTAGAICFSVPAPIGQYGGWRQLILEGNTFATRAVQKNQNGTRTAGSWTNK